MTSNNSRSCRSGISSSRSSNSSRRSVGDVEEDHDSIYLFKSEDGDDNGGHDDEDHASKPKLLSWRLDPEESLSDWTIIIQRNGNNNNDTTTTTTIQEDVYHVHKSILAVGPWKSDYFCAVFRQSAAGLAESMTQTSTIGLHDPAANVFPEMLDFLYDPFHTISITSQNVVALRHLSKYFGIRPLYIKVMRFLHNYYSMPPLLLLDQQQHQQHQQQRIQREIGMFLEPAMLFQDETVLSLVATNCIQSLSNISTTISTMNYSSTYDNNNNNNSNLLSVLLPMDPTFLVHRILSSPDMDTCSVSCHLSILLKEYCQYHLQDLTWTMFQQLTAKEVLPIIDRQAAVPLLELELTFLGQKNEDDDDEERNDTTTTTTITCLQQRCIKVLALHWKDLCSNNNSSSDDNNNNNNDNVQSTTTTTTTYTILRKLPNVVLVELLNKTVRIAHQNYQDVERNRLTSVANYQVQLDLAREDMFGWEAVHKAELVSTQQDAQDQMNQLRSQLDETKRQLHQYRREWENLQRVPLTYTGFSNIPQSTYHYASSCCCDQPFDDPCPCPKYGTIPPTSMPRIGLGNEPTNTNSEDGFLYLDDSHHNQHPHHHHQHDKKNTIKRWPVYYYKDD